MARGKDRAAGNETKPNAMSLSGTAGRAQPRAGSDGGVAKPRRVARNEDERQRKLAGILDASLDVFSEKGFADARLDEIAARAGVAKGTVYLYVSSKQDLLERLIRTGIALPIEEA